MRILIATKKGQGFRSNDFSHTEEGEPVYFGGGACDRDRDNIDGGCGCMRALIGMKSLKATTTFQVVQSDLTVDDLKALIMKAHADYLEHNILKESDVDDELNELLRIALLFPVGTVLEKRGDSIKVRALEVKK